MKGLIFTYALTYGGALVSLVRPFYGLLVYVSFAIIKPDELWHWAVPKSNFSEIVAIALLLGWAFNGFGNWRFGRSRPIAVALVAFWAWMSFGALFAEYRDVSFEQVKNLSKIFLPVLVGLTLIDNRQKLRLLAWTIILSAGYLAFTFNQRYFEGTFNPHTFRFGGMDANGWGISMVCALGLTLFVGLHSRRLWERGIALLLSLLMAHFILFGMSRGAFLAMGITFLTGFLILEKKPRHYVGFIGVTLAVLVLAGPPVQKELSTVFVDSEARGGSAQARLETWAICVKMAAAHPVLGVGIDNYPYLIEDYLDKEAWALVKRGREAHSLWLQVAAETGIPGILMYLGFYVLCVRRCWHYARRPAEAEEDLFLQGFARGVVAAMAGFFVAAQFVTVEGIELPYYVAMLGAGVVKIRSREVTSERRAKKPGRKEGQVKEPVKVEEWWRTRPSESWKPAVDSSSERH